MNNFRFSKIINLIFIKVTGFYTIENIEFIEIIYKMKWS